ncbi:MAG: type II toxin-antitoxin system RelE/ParE family toxin [Hyphomicrobiaceae bacterium]
MTIRFLAEAETEIANAEAWYAGQMPGLEERFLADVESGLALIEERPMAWQPLNGNLRQFLLRKFPYGIIYRITDDGILMLAVAHLHRKPGYWRDRT